MTVPSESLLLSCIRAFKYQHLPGAKAKHNSKEEGIASFLEPEEEALLQIRKVPDYRFGEAIHTAEHNTPIC